MRFENMKISFAPFGLALLLSACAQAPQSHKHGVSVPQVRVSDQYSRAAVKSYEVYESNIDGHAIMLVRLINGEHFPMVCRKVQSGIYPISQSVFATPSTERWSIMCEPHVRDVYALMRLELSRTDGALFVKDRRLKPSATARLLVSSAL